MELKLLFEFLQKNGIVIIGVVLAFVVAIWRISSYLQKNRLEERDAKIRNLKDRLEEIDKDNLGLQRNLWVEPKSKFL